MRNKLTKHSSKLVILSGFISILLLLLAIIIIANYSISNNTNSLNKIVNEHKDVDDIFAMRDAAQKRSLLIYEMHASEDYFQRDNIYLQLQKEAAKFILAREHLLLDKTSSIQSELWKNVQPLVINGVNSQENVINLLQSGQQQQANDMLKKVIPAQEMVFQGLTQMLETQNTIINNDLAATQIKNSQYHTAIFSLGIIAILLGVGIAIYVYRHNTRTELALITQQKIADSANKAKSTFLANMSHEIRTPLTAIIGFTEQVLNKNLSPPEQKKIKQTIIRNSKHLQDLINEILDLSKIESGQLEIEMTATSPVHINYEIESIISQRAKDKNLSFIVNNKFPLPSSIITDSIRLKQILLNLCSNAIKFTHDGEVHLNTTYDQDRNVISFSVTDTGVGLTAAEQKKIFDPFVQADVTTTRKFGGTGLGLSISYLLATELGGTLQCKSEKNKGSQFIFTLPTGINGKIKMITANETYIPLADNSLDNLEVKQLQGNILLAEDIKDNQDLISMYVKQTGAYLDIACNGEEAVNKALASDYDLILMDMQMPVIDGIEAISILRKKGYSKPIVSLTANAMSSDQEKCINAGADQFIAKPININEFYNTLNTYLKEKNKTNYTQNVESNITYGLEKLIQKFIDELPGKISQINSDLEKKDWEQIEHTSHFLKGIGSSFGFPEISASAIELNDAMHNKNHLAAPDLVKNLSVVCNTIIASHHKRNQL